MNKQDALAKIEELKKYVEEEDKKEAEAVGIQIKTVHGSVLFQSTKTTIKEALIEGVVNGANLREADLSEADLSEAELMNAKFYGRGGTKPLKKSQLPDFLGALGFVIED